MGFSGDDVSIGIGVRADPNAVQTIDNFRLKMAALRVELAQAANQRATVGPRPSDVTTINAAVGAFQKLSKEVDLNSARSVAGFRLQGDAISAYLQKLGATDAELGKIASTMALVEQRAGAASVAVNNTVTPQFEGRVGASSFAIRRAAVSFDGLAIAAATGAFSLRSFAQEMGGVAVGALSMSGATLGTSVAIGALIAVGVTLIGILDDVAKKSKTAAQNLDALREAAKKATSTDAIRQQLEATNKDLRTAQAVRDSLVNGPRQTAPISAFGPGGAPPVTAGQEALGNVDAQIKRLQIQAADLLNQLNTRMLEVGKTLSDSERQLNQEALRDFTKRTQGEFAERRLAAEQEFENEKKRLDDLAAHDGQQTAAVEAAKRRLREQLLDIDAEERQKRAEAQAERESKSITALEASRIATAKDAQASIDAAIQDARDRREISERQAIARRRDAAVAEINAEEQARLFASGQTERSLRTEAAGVTDPTRSAAITSAIKDESDKRTRIIADASQARQKVQTDAARQTADVTRQLRQEIETISVQSLQEQGKFLEAAKVQVQKEFRDALLEATAAGDTAAVAAIQNRIRVAIDQAQAKELEQRAASAEATAAAQIAQTNALVAGQLISQAQAHDRILASLVQERNAVEQLLPALRQVAADLPGDASAQAKVEQFETKLVELKVKIAELSDEFFTLKVGALEALQQGLADGIDQSITGAKSLAEVWATTANSIVHSIQRIVSQLLAQLVVQKLLGAIIGGGLDVPTPAFGTFNLQTKAGGGVIRGPGTGTSDSILALVSNGEGILTSRTMSREGEGRLDALNAGRATIVPRDSIRGYAEGGLVTATASREGGGSRSGFDGRISLAPGLIGEFMASDEGVQIQLANMRKNGQHVRAIVGTK